MRIRKTMWLFEMMAVAGLGSLLVAGTPGSKAGAPTDKTPAGIEVKIDNFTFGPMTLTVAPGSTVTWINNDDVPHTVVSGDRTFKSRALDTGEKFSYTFDKPGKYTYFCSVHPRMTAEVVVK